ncbi:hypothetical protein F5Y17DRAFT_459378 [Xylariaceae sp. FL0594]|nr:hypothetical protein F5Y17DRAFT_459378 [Xylariaceae sp. FL0594]
MPVKNFLITGATGRQGGAVVDALLKQHAEKRDPIRIIAVTRNIWSAPANALWQRSPDTIKLIEGDLDDVPAIFAAADELKVGPIWGVYSVQVSMGKDVTVDREIAQGYALVDEALKNGVQHFVYSSVERGGDVESWENKTPIPHFQAKYHIEHYLQRRVAETKGTMGWTILRPVAFMDNIAPGFPTKVFLTALRNWLGDKRVQWVSVRDIGLFAAAAFADPDAWNLRAVGLAGDECNVREIGEAFEAAGHQPPQTYSIFGSILTSIVSEMRLMIGWFASDGYKADIPQRRAEIPEMLEFKQWLAQESGFVKN